MGLHSRCPELDDAHSSRARGKDLERDCVGSLCCDVGSGNNDRHLILQHSVNRLLSLVVQLSSSCEVPKRSVFENIRILVSTGAIIHSFHYIFHFPFPAVPVAYGRSNRCALSIFAQHDVVKQHPPQPVPCRPRCCHDGRHNRHIFPVQPGYALRR